MFSLPVHTNPQKYSNSILAQFGSQLNSAGLLWGVGASAMLYQYGLADCPNDIDIIVAENDVKKADSILSAMGQKQEREESGIYATKYFYEYKLPSMDVDVMSGFRLNLPLGVYSYIFDEHSTPTIFNIDGTDIPFTTLEDWYVLYQLMPGKNQKALIVENYLREKGIRHPFLLKRMINQKTLSENVIERIKSLVEDSK
ncbi:hypothetical protein M2132_000951 [Dysgonomonas sp. PH5-45]|uniref:hypothetical protein n=1 Tax=unclassified Dysgonomonas TaxID=2630389 RepID=UPI002474F382|nr:MULTISPECIES: hypothetical protein [unclassified Dysgonomonas]MDH6354623.1 hypothetical protein [Dysgonomonas sp. PH5-45]MDH6387521.1 hypothetical protein [Dysgonomonas sp. PH5-37]